MTGEAPPLRPPEEPSQKSSDSEEPETLQVGNGRPHPPPLSLQARLLLLFLGWLAVVVGIVGLALPGIQGILTIVAGLALLSVASETAHRVLRRLMRPWPNAWEKVVRFRQRLRAKFSRKKKPKETPPGG